MVTRTRTAGVVAVMFTAASFAAASPQATSQATSQATFRAGSEAGPEAGPGAGPGAGSVGGPAPAVVKDAAPFILGRSHAESAARSVRPRHPPAPRAGEADPRGERTVRRPEATPTPQPRVAQGTSRKVGRGELRTFLVEVDAATGEDPDAFAAAVERTLFDPRSWTAGGRYTFQRVDEGPVDFRVTLAPPDVVDLLCAPLDTRGEYSCWNEERAVINHWRWRVGAHTYGQDLAGYRDYLVNHEVGHALGRGHVGCPSPGASAPVMMQQSVGVGACVPSAWPFPDG